MTLNTGATAAASPTAEIETEVSAQADASTAAASSTVDDQDDNQPASLLDVVKTVVQPTGPADTSGAEGEEGKTGTEAGTEGASSEETGDETDDSKLPFHQHPRWKQVVAERNAYREDAEGYRKVTGFMQEHGLSAEDMADAYDISAKLKSGDPQRLQEALEWLEPRVATLKAQLGHVLPEDLQEKVDGGELDEAGAQEIARLRATDSLRTQQAERQRETEATNATERQVREVSTAMATAVDEWEKGIKGSDPDYAKKADLVLAKSQAIVARTGKAPTNAEEAVALAKQAYAEANEVLKAAIPPKRELKPTPRGLSTPATTEPKSLKDAIRGALSS